MGSWRLFKAAFTVVRESRRAGVVEAAHDFGSSYRYTIPEIIQEYIEKFSQIKEILSVEK